MRPLKLLLHFLLSACIATAQESPYKLSSAILLQYSLDSTAYKSQSAAWAFSYIGEYENALKFFDTGKGATSVISAADSLYFSAFKPVDARRFILQQADDRQIIVINEAHHQPLHRVFTASLLSGLYNKGFRYFCAETLDPTDSFLNQRMYPTLKSGYYLKEPQYGQLIRAALRMGYSVLPYDYGDAANGSEREVLAARNIEAILKRDPKAKIFIHCGFDHIREDSNISYWGKAMAGRLKEYTGIDPLTIDQVKLTESSSSMHDNPLFKTIQLDYDAVFVDSGGRLFNGPEGSISYDVRVYHPRTNWKQGRPEWLYGEACKPYEVSNLIEVSFPCVVMAYLPDELSADAIPVDVIELKGLQDPKPLVLPPGQYTVIVRDTAGKEQRLTLKQ